MDNNTQEPASWQNKINFPNNKAPPVISITKKKLITTILLSAQFFSLLKNNNKSNRRVAQDIRTILRLLLPAGDQFNNPFTQQRTTHPWQPHTARVFKFLGNFNHTKRKKYSKNTKSLLMTSIIMPNQFCTLLKCFKGNFVCQCPKLNKPKATLFILIKDDTI